MASISIIICSRTKKIPVALEVNIKNTIGIDYELIVIDNSLNNYTIFEAYNLGVKQSNTSYLCFIHDDICFDTNNWGAVLLDIFKNDNTIGLIGIAGAKVKTKMPSPWWNCHDEQRVINIIQHKNSGEKEKIARGFSKSSETEVVVIDGVFMVLRKSVNIGFNNKMEGFHNYDSNLSFECMKRGYRIVVTNNILIEHYSQGSLNKDWLNSTFEVHKEYKSILPLQTGNYSLKKADEKRNAVSFMKHCIEFNNMKLFYTIWVKLFLFHPNLKYHFKLWRQLKTEK